MHLTCKLAFQSFNLTIILWFSFTESETNINLIRHEEEREKNKIVQRHSLPHPSHAANSRYWYSYSFLFYPGTHQVPFALSCEILIGAFICSETKLLRRQLFFNFHHSNYDTIFKLVSIFYMRQLGTYKKW